MPRPRFDRLDPSKRAAVLAEAAREFVAHSYHEASLNRVQKGLGLSKGAFYYWFDDKEDLFLAVLQQQLDTMAQAVGGLLTAPPDRTPLWGQVEDSIARILAYVAHEPEVMALYKAALTLPPSPGSRVDRLLSASISATEQLVVEGQSRGEVRTDLPAALLAHAAHGLLEGLDRYALGQSPPPDTDSRAQAAVYVSLLKGVLAPR